MDNINHARTDKTMFKRQATNQTISIWFTGYYPDFSHSYKARIADSTHYMGDYNVTPDGRTFKLDTGQLKDFPVGVYRLEIWETYYTSGQAQTGIYPEPDNFVTFEISENIADTAGDQAKAFNLDEAIGKAAAKMGANTIYSVKTLSPDSQVTVDQSFDGTRAHITLGIPKGDKGDKGNTGDTGPKGDTGPQGNPGTGFNVTTLKAGTDLNTLTSAGTYNLSGVSAKNLPNDADNMWGMMLVMSDGSDTATQLVQDSPNNRIYYRTVTNRLTRWRDWEEVASMSSLKNGGVTSANLVDDKMPQMNDLSTTNNVSTGHLGSQRFAKIAGEILPVTSIFLDVMNGDTIAQAITVRTDGKVNNITFTFHDNKNNLHHVVPADVDQLEAGVYRASARYTFNVDGKLRALDLMDVKVDGATYIDLASPYVGLVQSGG